jgi:aerobic-type carbon monoxide dehydrogenase small subunit (CoxS/CutS family)
VKKSFRVNGASAVIDVEPGDSLLDVLRDRLGLTGTKVGCEVGECGTCTVLLDGRPRLSCITLAIRVDAEVTTVEGLGAEADSLRRSFAEEGGLQCGYCTPGQVVNAYAIVFAGEPTDAESIRRRMSGNICRCTGYAGIVRAVQRELGGTS